MLTSKIETDVTNYMSYTITTRKGYERGIFFRLPIQKMYFDADPWYAADDRCAFEYVDKVEKSRLRRIYEIIIGNGPLLKSIKENSEFLKEDINFAGFWAYCLCFPIYFSRRFRQLDAYDTSNEKNISEIHSYGYESQFSHANGECQKETTTIVLKNGKKTKKISKGEAYHFTYIHIIKDLIYSKEDVYNNGCN